MRAIAQHHQPAGILLDELAVDEAGNRQVVVAVENFLDAFTAGLAQLDAVFAFGGAHFGLHSTPSSDSAIRRATATSAASPPAAALPSQHATCCHVALSRKCAGRCFAISERTSASVASVITFGMTSGRGRRSDQFGRAMLVA